MAFVEKALLNAFHPGAALDDPFLFAGRRDQIIELAQNLHIEGTCPIIYGARGLGKSSLALQVRRIAMGDVTLLEDHGARQWVLGEDDAYLAFYVPCLDSMEDTASILQRIINSFSSVTIEETPDANQLIDRTTTKRLTLKPFHVESLRRYQLPEKPPAYDSLALDEKLLDMAARLSEAYQQRILVIVDELDVVRETRGFASFIKNASSSDLKFILVGIGQDVSNLLNDHQSIERIAVPVRIPHMKVEELAQIVDRAVAKLADMGVPFTFKATATQTLAKLASGFPWFVHLIGQEALLAAYRANETFVNDNDVAVAVDSLVNSRFAQQFRDQYQRAVRDSHEREMVLRTFALWPSQDIPTSEVHRVLRRLGIARPSAYTGHLSSASFGHILMKPPFQKRGVLRFANEMFKVYVKARRPLFDIDGRIREAWRAEFRGTEFALDAEPVVASISAPPSPWPLSPWDDPFRPAEPWDPFKR